MSIRDRLTIIYTGIFLLAFLLFTLVVYHLPRVSLRTEIDESLEDTALEMLEETQVLSQRDVLSLFIPTEDDSVFRRANIFIMVVDEEGEVLRRSDNLRGFQGILDPDGLGAETRSFHTVTYEGQPVRVLTVPLRVERGSAEELIGYLQVARVVEAYDTFNRLLIIAVFIGLASVTASMFTVTWIAPKVFRPLENIAALARQISRADDLSRRLPDTGRNDEIGDLTVAVNQTLERLETLFRTQQRFLADVSHELRTPLTTIRGNVDLMRRMGVADASFLDDIQAELERMTRLVNDLLLLARADVGSLPIEHRLVELDTVVLDVYRQLSKLNRPVRVVLEEVDQVAVMGDEDRLKQLILNLADNAIKYTSPGGVVSLRLCKTVSQAQLSISDTGIGIPEEDLPYIFDRFYRVDKARTRAHGGSGLGLSIAKWIVEVHDGEIEVESEVGKGTTFHIYLPLAPEKISKVSRGGPSSSHSSLARQHG
ncbi:MAG TPA: ATP-binding protein [Candidatus Sulfomarinibacteraceae bacterium]|nr:ATP-binding protein [Candidatus Sulfomarinibacteraceae bacterium]